MTMATQIHISSLVVILPAVFVGLLLPSCTADNILYSGDTLYAGQSLSYGGCAFTMQSDCNLVLYDYGDAVWSSGTYGRGHNCVLAMQSDGNLVIYSNGYPVWSSNSGRRHGYYVLILQPDHNLVIYGPPIWGSSDHVGDSVGVIVSQNASSTIPVVVATATSQEPRNRKMAMLTNN